MMNFAYYVVRGNDMTLVDVADDVATAINKAEELGQKVIILQGCVITEMGTDEEIVPDIQTDDEKHEEITEYENISDTEE